MRRIKNPKYGEYVLLSRWGDHDYHDPWYIGTLEGTRKYLDGTMGYKVHQCERWFPCCFRITWKEGAEWIGRFGNTNTTKVEDRARG